jgi:hypothetical protein
MPSWEDIQTYVRSNYNLSSDKENHFSMVWKFDNDRTHKILVRKFSSFGEDWLEFRAVVCKGSEMAPQVALRKNLQFSIGALGLDSDDDYVLVHNQPLKTMDMEEFLRPLNQVAKTADKIEAEYSGDNDKW